MSGRNQNGILVNNSSSQQAKLFIDAYRTNFTYPAWFENTLGFAESGQITVSELQRAADNLLNQGLMKPKPSFQTFTGNQKQAIDQRIRNMYGDDIQMLHGHASDLGTSLQDAKKERTSLQGKIDKLNLDSDLFHTMHTDQESRITRNAEMIGNKSDKGHKHACTDCGECEWYDIFCKMGNFQSEVGKYAIIAGVGIVGFFLLKKRLGL